MLGVDFKVKMLNVDNKRVKMTIWDTGKPESKARLWLKIDRERERVWGGGTPTERENERQERESVREWRQTDRH